MAGITSITDAAALAYSGRSSINSLPAINEAVNTPPDSRKPDFQAVLNSAAAEKGGNSGRADKPSIEKNSELYEQCEALETFLLKTLINGMRRTVDKSEFSKGGFREACCEFGAEGVGQTRYDTYHDKQRYSIAQTSVGDTFSKPHDEHCTGYQAHHRRHLIRPKSFD